MVAHRVFFLDLDGKKMQVLASDIISSWAGDPSAAGAEPPVQEIQCSENTRAMEYMYDKGTNEGSGEEGGESEEGGEGGEGEEGGGGEASEEGGGEESEEGKEGVVYAKSATEDRRHPWEHWDAALVTTITVLNFARAVHRRVQLKIENGVTTRLYRLCRAIQVDMPTNMPLVLFCGVVSGGAMGCNAAAFGLMFGVSMLQLEHERVLCAMIACFALSDAAPRGAYAVLGFTHLGRMVQQALHTQVIGASLSCGITVACAAILSPSWQIAVLITASYCFGAVRFLMPDGVFHASTQKSCD